MRALKFHSLFLIKLLNFSWRFFPIVHLPVSSISTAAGGGHSDVGPVSRFPATVVGVQSKDSRLKSHFVCAATRCHLLEISASK
jgi:hypothetical protein